MAYSVGELAKRSGLTVRTLHHYEQLGLLTPSARSDAGYRLYADEDVRTLHRILAYRQMGLALKDIAALMAARNPPPLQDLLAKQIELVQAEITERQRLLTTLQRVSRRAQAGELDLTDDFFQLMSSLRMLERHFSAEEIDEMRALQNALPPEVLRRMTEDAPRLLAELRAAMDAKVPVDSPQVLAIMREWDELDQLLGASDAMRDKGRAMVASEPEFRQKSGLDPALMAYYDAAMAAFKGTAAPGEQS